MKKLLEDFMKLDRPARFILVGTPMAISDPIGIRVNVSTVVCQES